MQLPDNKFQPNLVGFRRSLFIVKNPCSGLFKKFFVWRNRGKHLPRKNGVALMLTEKWLNCYSKLLLDIGLNAFLSPTSKTENL
jgi:hypothetical protein